ncbi:hypothetical protein GEI7407_1324 [Geitlerinema sp. PCC 7407]|nr:hypothetical protein GEI7407_1324 [Geitlerinema sp. PCC 7407]
MRFAAPQDHGQRTRTGNDKIPEVCQDPFPDTHKVTRMVSVRLLSQLCVTPLLVAASLGLVRPAATFAQSALPDAELDQPAGATDLDEARPVILDSSILSMPGGQRLMQEASAAVSSENYTLAAAKLQEARQVFNQLSNFYQEIASSFSGIDNRIADSQRRKALDTAQMRDEATYQLALVHRAQNKPELAVPLLVQLVRSQQPTRDLGQKAYQQLFELGFVDAPYPRSGGDTSAR